MDQIDTFVVLCGQTDGRDKIYKSMAGLFKILGETQMPNAKKFAAFSKAIGSGRSLMRMGKWTSNMNKLQAYIPTAASLTAKNMVEILRIIGDFGFVLGDNLHYISSYNIVPIDPRLAHVNSKMFQFFGFICAVVLDMWNLVILQLEGQIKTKKFREGILTLIKDLCDTIACMVVVRYNSGYGGKPSASLVGGCSLISGCIATRSNWKKAASKPKAD
eukprot:Tbor_TRINITY_DN2005_c0_g1::TRINITY_DN2005_c0_g1_i1::g.12114::m.12114